MLAGGRTGKAAVMDLSRKPEARMGFSPEFWRELVGKIVAEDDTLNDLAAETGIPREVLRKWTLTAERAGTRAASVDEPLVPASRVRELEREVEELRRLLGRQAVRVDVLREAGNPVRRSKVEGRKPEGGLRTGLERGLRSKV